MGCRADVFVLIFFIAVKSLLSDVSFPSFAFFFSHVGFDILMEDFLFIEIGDLTDTILYKVTRWL